ncbi:hypothetical protein AAFF_G00354830 [Aldrovandia affinis]|uniref:Integrase catalytic domain-containing protein n=1 Tax=Aldrovandia affinis TaxID=143900 RepID=A0AAD7SKN5_9TELE|nr:hypothetical protein AAFF_G00354830 [Aldrovandia affinis]
MSDSEDNEEQAPLQQAAESEESRRAPAVEMNVSAFLSPIQPFLATPGDPPLPWKIWKQQFSTYLLATGLNTAPKEQQLAILLDSLGTEGQRIFATLPDDVTEKSYFDEEEDELFIQQTFIDELQAAITPEELARETLQDPVLKEVLCYMKTGWEADFTCYLEKKGISHQKTPLYHPLANAGVERFNKVLKYGLRALLQEGRQFSDALKTLLLSYRSTPHRVTGRTPAELMIGRTLRVPLTQSVHPV